MKNTNITKPNYLNINKNKAFVDMLNKKIEKKILIVQWKIIVKLS